MEICRLVLNAKLLKEISETIEPCFKLIENDLKNNTVNQFTCSVTDLSKKNFEATLNKRFIKCLNQGGIYFIRIATTDSFDASQLKTEWSQSRSLKLGKRPEAVTNHDGKCTIIVDQHTDECVLYVGSSLKIGSRIKAHFRNSKISPSTSSLRLRWNPNKYLINVNSIIINWVSFEGLSNNDKKEEALHNLCRYFESKLGQKYKALIGE